MRCLERKLCFKSLDLRVRLLIRVSCALMFPADSRLPISIPSSSLFFQAFSVARVLSLTL